MPRKKALTAGAPLEGVLQKKQVSKAAPAKAVLDNAPKALVPVPKLGIAAGRRRNGVIPSLTPDRAATIAESEKMMGRRSKGEKNKGFVHKALKVGKHVWKFLKGAGKAAVQIAPYLLPLIFGSHQPTLQLMQAEGIAPGSPQHLQLMAYAHQVAGTASFSQPLTGASSAPLAYGGPTLMNKVGRISQRTRSKNGRVIGETLRGMDFLAALGSPAAGYAQGDLIYKADISPLGAAFIGTRVAQLAATFELYKFRNVTIVYEPVCPATTGGGIVGFIDPDPLDDDTFDGISAIRKATAHQGSDCNQVWAAGLYTLPGDRKRTDLFIDANGTDARFVKFGNFFLHATVAIGGNLSLGNLYLVYDFEVDYPQIDDDNAASGIEMFMYRNGTPIAGSSFTNPWGTADPSLAYQMPTNADLTWYWDGTVWWLQGLPVGKYYVDSLLVGTGLTEDASPEGAVEFDSAATGTIVSDNYFGTATTVTGFDQITVLEYIDPNAVPRLARGLKYNADLTASTTITTVRLHIIQQDAYTSMRKKRMTAQDYEKKVDVLEPQVQELQTKLDAVLDYIKTTEEKGKSPMPQLQLVDREPPPSTLLSLQMLKARK